MRSQKRVKKTVRVTDRKSKAKNANKKLKRKQTKISRNPLFGEKWDAKKTVKQNMKSLGLAYDPNDVVMQLNAESKENADNNEVEFMDIELAKEAAQLSKGQKKRARKAAKKNANETSVVSMLEAEAQKAAERRAAKSVTRAHKDEVRFCSEIISRHGLDFEAMARDPNNIWQYTPNQIRRMLDKFKKSPAFTVTNMEV